MISYLVKNFFKKVKICIFLQIFNKKVNNLVKNGINITFYKKIAKMVEKFDTINVRKKIVDLLKKFI